MEQKSSLTSKEELKKLSYSDFRLYQRCPLAYKLGVIDKLSPDRGEVNRRYLRGAVCHDALHRWIVDHKCQSLEGWAYRNISDRAFVEFTSRNEVEFYGGSDYERMKEECDLDFQKICIAFFKTGLHKRPLRSEWLIEAYDKDLDVKLTGRVDLFDTDKHIIYDMKVTTDRVYFDWQQGLYYAYVIYRMQGDFPQKFGQFVPLCEKKIEWFNFTSADLSIIEGSIFDTVGNIKDSKFEPTADRVICENCSLRSVCPVHN